MYSLTSNQPSTGLPCRVTSIIGASDSRNSDGRPSRLWPGPLLSVLLGVAVSGSAGADHLVLPSSWERARTAQASYRFDAVVTGTGFLDIEWSDATGRIVDRRHIPLDLTEASEVTFTLDAGRAVTMKNKIAAHLSLDFMDQSGSRIHRENREAKDFIVTPTSSGWADYQIIMWQRQTPAAYATLKKLGITAGMLETNHREEPVIYAADSLASILDADLRCYLENIATDFYSPYHKWYAGREVNWRFLEAKRRYWANPQDRTAFIREPSLSDTEWLKNIEDRLSRNVRGAAGLPSALLQPRRRDRHRRPRGVLGFRPIGSFPGIDARLAEGPLREPGSPE